METKSLKALAIKVLQGNIQGNKKETNSCQGGNRVETSGTSVETFCSWADRNVADCEEPCLENKAGIVTRQCPHFKAWWGERVQWLTTNRPGILAKSEREKPDSHAIN